MKERVTAEDYSAAYFRGHVQRYAEGIYASRVEAISRHLSGLEGKRVLDLGCGIGVFSQLAASKGARVASSDYSKAALEFCAETAPGTSRILNGAEQLPFKNCAFDFVLAADLIEHLYDPPKFLAEVHRVLVPGGRLLVSTDNESFLGLLPGLRGLHCLLLGLSPLQRKLETIQKGEAQAMGKSYASFMHVNCMRLEQLLRLLKKAGFAVKEWDTFSFLCTPLWDDFFSLPLVSSLFRRVRADRLVVLCERP